MIDIIIEIVDAICEIVDGYEIHLLMLGYMYVLIVLLRLWIL
jgi:hypothetical protein